MENLINYSAFLRSACKPLFDYLPIVNFRYAEIAEDGRYFVLSSNEQFYEEYFKRGYFCSTPLNMLTYYGRTGFYLDDDYPLPNEVVQNHYKTLLGDFDYGHSLSIIHQPRESNQIVYKAFIFDAKIKDKNVNNLYLNNLDVLKQFNRYINEKINTIKNSVTTDIILPEEFVTFKSLFYQTSSTSADILANKTNILSELGSLTKMNNALSQREMEVIIWYMKGKNAEETSKILGISKRTVETYFERIFKKLNCFTKSQAAFELSKWLEF